MLFTPQLPRDLKGQVLTPEDPAYDEARTVFAAHIDRRPALIARVAGPDDIARVIAHARETGSELAVRSGGHSPAGHGVCDGGIVIDLSALRSFELDAAGRTAWAGAGLTAGAFTVAAGEHGLATGFGDTGSVGIGGITLAGGIGFLVRKHGLTIDNLLAAEIVTADGRLRRVDARDRAGAVLGAARRRRQLRRRHAPEVPAAPGRHGRRRPARPPRDARRDRRLRRGGRAAPDELSTIANVMLGAAAAVRARGAARQPRGDGEDGLRGRRRGGPARRRALPRAGRAGRRPPAADEVPGDVSRRAGLPPRRGGTRTSSPAASAPGRRRRSSSGSASRRRRWPPARSACSAARWPACPRTPRPSPTAGARSLINVAAIYDPSTSERSEHAAWARRALGRARRRRPRRLRGPPRRRGRGARPRGVPRRDVGAAGRGQGHLRPRQRVPAQPEHPARGVDRRRGRRPTTPPSGLAEPTSRAARAPMLRLRMRSISAVTLDLCASRRRS